MSRVLVAGIGNIFLGDDGFGVEVARRLAADGLPNGAVVFDFGVRGIDLAYAIEKHDAAILVDATQRGGEPGTVYVLEPELQRGQHQPASPDGHRLTPDRVLSMLEPASWPSFLRVVGCEPESFGAPGLGRVGLSPPVSGAVAPACRRVRELVSTQLWEADHA